jgi:uncharacterized protein
MPFEQSSGDGSGDNRVHTEPYTIKEFRGHYHVHKIESKRPILGTQVKVELARLEWRHKHAERLEQSSIQRNLKAKKDRELRVKTFKVLQKMRENYGVGKTFNRIQAIVDARGKEVERMIQSSIEKDKKLTIRFWRAVKRGDIHQINDLIVNRGFEGVNVPRANGETAIVLAVRNRDTHFAEGLLSLGANPNTKDHAGRPAFLMPWSEFEINARLRSEVARKEGDYIVEMSLLLLAYGCDINAQRFDGNTSLHLAARYNMIKLTIPLIRLGADPYVENLEGENVFDYCDKFSRGEIRRVVSNYQAVADDMRITEFTQKWRKFIFVEEKMAMKNGKLVKMDRQPLSITPAVSSLIEDFENTDRAVRGQMGNGIRTGKPEDPADSGPELKKKAKMNEAEMALKVWRNKKTDAKDERAAFAHSLLPSQLRMKVYTVKKGKKQREIVKGMADEKSVATRTRERRKSVALCVASDAMHGNKRESTIQIRPATASLVFYRGKNPVTAAPITDPNALRKELKAKQRQEALELQGGSNKRKEATLNSASILPPTIHKSVKNGHRLNVNHRPIAQTWRPFAAESLSKYTRRQKKLPLFAQTLKKTNR